MDIRSGFPWARKKLPERPEDRGISFYLMGIFPRDGEEAVLVRAENEEAPLADCYYPGGIEILRPELWKTYCVPIGTRFASLYDEEESLREQSEELDFAGAVRIAKDLRVNDADAWKRFFKRELYYPLYSDVWLRGGFSSIVRDETGDHAYVVAYFNDLEGADENGEQRIVVRLPEGEIVAVYGVKDAAAFAPDSLKTEQVGEALQRIMLGSAVILEMAHTVDEPDCTDDKKLNALRDKIDGKIVRSIHVECPHCHRMLLSGDAIFTVEVPVGFYADMEEFVIFEHEVYEAVRQAVNEGRVTGECQHCHHALTAKDINRDKEGWQYRWRYDPEA